MISFRRKCLVLHMSQINVVPYFHSEHVKVVEPTIDQIM